MCRAISPQRGIAAVNVGYRLATHAAYPGATQDIAAAVDWARAHAHEYGWNPDRVFLMSHSAGAAHAEAMRTIPRSHRPDDRRSPE